MPFLSIITINCNNAAGLRKTLESVRMQTFTDYEHIIVDGGSTDDSVEVIKEFLSDEGYASHVTWWCSEKDGGIYSAMNKGIRHACGIYIATLNSGDAYVSNALCGLLETASNNPNAILYGAISTFKNGDFEGAICTGAKNLDRGMIPHPASFVPKSLYAKYGLYDESFKSSGDWELFIRFFLGAEKFVYLNKIITEYDLGGISTTHTELVQKENKRLLIKHGLWNYKKQIKYIIKKMTHLLFFYFQPFSRLSL